MKSKGIRIAALFMVMLVVSMFSVVPAMACVPGGTCGEKTCDDNIMMGEPVELKGNDRDELLDKALADKAIISLKEELKEEGFEQKDVETYSLEITAEDGFVVDAKVSTFKFEDADGNIDGLTYAYNDQTGESLAVRGVTDCGTCLTRILIYGIGCSAVCVSGGVLTMGALCVACLAAAAYDSLCPCYLCGCSEGFEDACEMAEIHC